MIQEWLNAEFSDGPNGWIECKPSNAMVEHAQNLRDERNSKKYREVFQMDYGSPLKWVGELGELGLASYLISKKINGKWHRGNPIANTDITVSDQKIDVKTVKRQVPMRPEYGVQISGISKLDTSDWFFFCCYEQKRDVLVLLGAITPKKFVESGKYYGSGEQVHPNYRIPKGHSIYNAAASVLIPTNSWLELISKK